MPASVTCLRPTIIERVIAAGENAHPGDIADLKKEWAEVARPTPDQVDSLIPVLHGLGEIEFLETNCPHEYLDWQSKDEGDREYGGPPIPERGEELHPED